MARWCVLPINFRWLAVLGVTTVAVPSLAAAAALPYPAPDGAPRASDFSVRVDGREAFVLETAVAGVASFSSDREVEVEVRTRDDVRRVDLRPKSLGVEPVVVEPHLIRFRLARPCQASLELNGESERVLLLFFDPPETDAPRAGAPGVRTFAPGRVHEAGTIELRDGETLYIPAGAIVRGTVSARDARGVRILGRGILQSPATGAPEQNLIRLERCREVTIDGITVVDSRTWTTLLAHCEDVVLRRVKLVNWRNGSDGVDVVSSRRVRISDSFLRDNDDCVALKALPWGGPRPWEAKGPAPDVTDVTVERCVVWNMAWGNALEIGFELRSAAVRGVVFRDIDVIHTVRGAVLSIHNGDTATVSDIRYEDIRVEDARHKLIDLAVFYSQYSVDRPTDQAEVERRYLHGAWDGVLSLAPPERAAHAAFRGHIRNVVFKDVRIVDGPFPFSILAGYDAEHAVEQVRIEGLRYLDRRLDSAAAGRFQVENAREVTFR